MFKKIFTRDYLKGYADMNAEERKAYLGRVGEWLAKDGARLLVLTDRPMARSQSIMTITARWTIEDSQALTDGIILITALVTMADTWLPTQLYMKSAYRAVRKMVEVLSEVNNKTGVANNSLRPDVSKRPEAECLSQPNSGNKTSADGKIIAADGKITAADGKITAAGGNKTAAGGKIAAADGKIMAADGKIIAESEKLAKDPLSVVTTEEKESDGTMGTEMPARPKHIDQYVHLLPKATQERASHYGELMQELDKAREETRLLMNDPNTSRRSLEQLAKKTAGLDAKIGNLRKELDREWEKVAKSGRVVVDDLGMAHLLSDEGGSVALQAGGTLELTSEEKKRRRDLRKWLIDLRRGKEGKDREKRIGQWRENWKEYLTLEPREKALEDEKILEAAKHFGIDLREDSSGDGAKE